MNKENKEFCDCEGKDAKWITHYCSSHRILLVGEGDFSFSLCLANAFGSAQNITATSLDSEGELMRKYSAAETNLRKLKEMGCTIVHEVDVHNMSLLPFFRTRESFDRIVFNFPHAGFFYMEHDPVQIGFHRTLVKGFFSNAKDMLRRGGEVHVTHKTAYPFSNWKISDLANEVGLYLKNEAPFYLYCYPDYQNKRGAGSRDGARVRSSCDDTFPVGECSSFQFAKLN